MPPTSQPRSTSSSLLSSLSLSTGMATEPPGGAAAPPAPRSLHATGLASPTAGRHHQHHHTADSSSDAVSTAAASIKTQITSLGQQLDAMYRRSEGEGLAPAIPRPGSGLGGVPGATAAGALPLGGATSASLRPSTEPALLGLSSRGVASASRAALAGALAGASSLGASALRTTSHYAAGAGAAAYAQSPTRASATALGAGLGTAYASPERRYTGSRAAAGAGIYGSPTTAGLGAGMGAAGAGAGASYYPGAGAAAAVGLRSPSAYPSYQPQHSTYYATGSAAASGYMPSPPPPNMAGGYGRAGNWPAAGAGGAGGGYGAGTGAATGAGGAGYHQGNTVVRSLADDGYGAGAAGRGAGGAGATGVEAVVGARENERLRELLTEMRGERRRLEDRLLGGDSHGMRLQDMRDDLEKQVGHLSRQRDILDAEAGGLIAAREAAAAASAEAEGLRAALGQEQLRSAHLQEMRELVEARLADLAAAVDALQEQHTQAVSALTKERDTLALKYKGASKKAAGAEGDADRIAQELATARQELHARDLALAEVRASAEVLQSANAQLQGQLGAANKELEAKCAELARQVDAVSREAREARGGAADAQKLARIEGEKVKELSSRAEFLRSEREKLLKVLASEQATSASLKQEVEVLSAKLRAVEATRSEDGAAARAQIEALSREHEARVTGLTRQFEAQLAAAEKAAAAAQRQASSSVTSGEKLLEVQLALRRERDALASEVDSLRQDLANVGRERDELATKVSMLRAEVKATMDDVMQDREVRVRGVQHAHEAAVAELTQKYEARLASLSGDSETKIAGMMDLIERLKAEVAEAQRGAERQRASVATLKEQLKQVLVAKDDLERELAQEKQFNGELNSIVNQLKRG